MKQVLKDGYEYDLVSRWRKLGIVTANSGVWKYVKKKLNKRIRKDGKQNITEELRIDE